MITRTMLKSFPVNFNDVISEQSALRGVGIYQVSSGETISGIHAGQDSAYIHGGIQIHNGGQTFFSEIHSGATEQINSGGTATSTTLYGGGYQRVELGGEAHGTIISGQGEQHVYGLSFDTVVYGHGVQSVHLAAIATGTVILQEGRQDLDGKAIDTTLINGGAQIVNSTAIASNTTISGGIQVVKGYAYNTTLYARGEQQAIGVVSRTTINGGWQPVYGEVYDTTINSTGRQTVFAGTANRTTINRGGLQEVILGPVANDTIINAQGSQIISYARANRTMVNSGGVMELYESSTADNTIVNSGGTMVLNGESYLAGTTTIGGTMTINGPVRADGTTFVFAVNQRSVDDGVMVNNLGLLYNVEDYRITVSGDQTGTYALAGGGPVFDSLVYLSVDGELAFGRLAVGSSISHDSKEYSLDVRDGILYLDISAGNSMELTDWNDFRAAQLFSESEPGFRLDCFNSGNWSETAANPFTTTENINSAGRGMLA